MQGLRTKSWRQDRSMFASTSRRRLAFQQSGKTKQAQASEEVKAKAASDLGHALRAMGL